ncbi:hypothetical protein [Nocardia sp. NPDC020380]|uniref:hypothetical protein n=1 Tax=Nocardia sp. NPDC020380 TaxID=3364309 RepID=UPI0037BC438F
MATQDSLDGYINKIYGMEAKIYSAVSDIDRDFAGLMGGGGVLSLPFLDGIGEGWLRSKRDEAKSTVNKMVNGDPQDNSPGFKQFVEGIKLPVTLIDLAAKWRLIEQDVIDARNLEREAGLGAYWEGGGETNYENMRTNQQDPAYAAMVAFCEKVAVELETVAQSVVQFYSTLNDQIYKLLEAIKNFLSNIFSLKFVQGFVDLVDDTCGAIVTTISAIVSALASFKISSNHLQSMTAAQDGFSSLNKWPVPETNVFADFSADDDGSPYRWSSL